MFIWDKKDTAFIESCLDPAKREGTIRKEKRDRWIGFAIVSAGLASFLVYSQKSMLDLWIPIFFLTLGFHTHAMSTVNLRFAKLAKAISERNTTR